MTLITTKDINEEKEKLEQLLTDLSTKNDYQKYLEQKISDIENKFQNKSSDDYKNNWISIKLEEKLNLKNKNTRTELPLEEILESKIKEIENKIYKIKFKQENDNKFKEKWVKNSDKLKKKIKNMSINDPDYENLDIFLKRMKKYKITSPNLENQFQQFTMSAVREIYDKTMKSYSLSSTEFELYPYQIKANNLFLKNKLLAEKELENSLMSFHLKELDKQLNLIYQKENETIKNFEKEIFELKINHDKEFALEWKLKEAKQDFYIKIRNEFYQNRENEDIFELEKLKSELKTLKLKKDNSSSKKKTKYQNAINTCSKKIQKIENDFEGKINTIFNQKWSQRELEIKEIFENNWKKKLEEKDLKENLLSLETKEKLKSELLEQFNNSLDNERIYYLLLIKNWRYKQQENSDDINKIHHQIDSQNEKIKILEEILENQKEKEKLDKKEKELKEKLLSLETKEIESELDVCSINKSQESNMKITDVRSLANNQYGEDYEQPGPSSGNRYANDPKAAESFILANQLQRGEYELYQLNLLQEQETSSDEEQHQKKETKKSFSN